MAFAAARDASTLSPEEECKSVGAVPTDLLPEIKRRLAVVPFQEAIDHIQRLSGENSKGESV